MSAEIRKVADDLYFIEWGNVRFAGSAAMLESLCRDIRTGLEMEAGKDRILQRLRERQAGKRNGLDDGPPDSIVRYDQ